MKHPRNRLLCLPAARAPSCVFTSRACLLFHLFAWMRAAYAVLAPSDAVRQAVAKARAKVGPCYAAIHVRRTDLHTAIPASKHTTDAAFEAFADGALRSGGSGAGGGGGSAGGAASASTAAAAAAATLYVATDNAPTQQRFVARYDSARCHVAAPIKPSDKLRQTGLVEAATDLLVCAHAPCGFMGSYYSSFSDAIRFMRVVLGTDEAAEPPPPPPPPPTKKQEGGEAECRGKAGHGGKAAPAAVGRVVDERNKSADAGKTASCGCAATSTQAQRTTAPYSLDGAALVTERQPHAGRVDVLELD